ncbi:MAG: MotA/TolQ/ExbB proton channel family protein [Candidatus Sericytochromatia bacterium]|nr:MotA/TolQ/ExbB proton channel family protein [Candidatus Tanganyikabacteria bacterium]
MNLSGLVQALGLAGGEWVLYILLAASVLSVTIILDRVVYFVGNREPAADVLDRALAALGAGEGPPGRPGGPVGRMSAAAHVAWRLGPERLRAALLAHRLRERNAAERGLVILGTLGNNAPFIGLFGTVLGIIRAFHDLGASASQGPAAVMTGISEALVATAVGILVAIPAVIAYNLCQRQIKVMDYQLEEAAEALHALALATPREAAAQPALPGAHAR